jgi:hypothetical protein
VCGNSTEDHRRFGWTFTQELLGPANIFGQLEGGDRTPENGICRNGIGICVRGANHGHTTKAVSEGSAPESPNDAVVLRENRREFLSVPQFDLEGLVGLTELGEFFEGLGVGHIRSHSNHDSACVEWSSISCISLDRGL